MNLLYVLATLLSISLIILVHEWGHFQAARMLGVGVKVFSIGFGKPFWSMRSKHNTLIQISPFLLGGYVELIDTRTEPKKTASTQALAFDQQALWVKLSILLAGPIMNLILATVLFSSAYYIGFIQTKPIIQGVLPQTIASAEKLPSNVVIDAINGEKTPGWEAVFFELIEHYDDSKTITMTLSSLTGKPTKQTIMLSLASWRFTNSFDLLESLGIVPFQPKQPVVIKRLIKGGPAMRAGLKKQDKIVAINGQKTENWKALDHLLRIYKNKTVTLSIARKDPTTGASMILKKTSKLGWSFDKSWHLVGYLGIEGYPSVWPKNTQRHVKKTFFGALQSGLHKTVGYVDHHIIVFKKLLLGSIPLKALIGPVGIFQFTHHALTQQISYALFFIGMLNVAVAFVNLLPLPVLDGGQMVITVLESVRKKAFSPAVILLMHRLSIIVLVVIVFHALLNDINRTIAPYPQKTQHQHGAT